MRERNGRERGRETAGKREENKRRSKVTQIGEEHLKVEEANEHMKREEGWSGNQFTIVCNIWANILRIQTASFIIRLCRIDQQTKGKLVNYGTL